MVIENFQIDCAKKSEQIEFLQSLRSTPDQRATAVVEDTWRFWEVYIDPAKSQERRNLYQRRYDWLIAQKMMRLQWDCGPNTPR